MATVCFIGLGLWTILGAILMYWFVRYGDADGDGPGTILIAVMLPALMLFLFYTFVIDPFINRNKP